MQASRSRWRLPGTSASRIEDSLRLRLLGLSTYWLAALAVAWVGGSPWSWAGGGVAVTVGHAFSWHRRHRNLGVWSMVLLFLIVALALVMQAEILAVLDGNWLPLAHFLLLVQAIASFDMRTRSGLYGGLAMSGIVLFFASQQAFELSFGIFLLGYVALLAAFLAVSLFEDEGRASGRAQGHGGKTSILGFWSATAAGVLLLSVGAFLLLPRGEGNAVGYQQASVLPITGDPTGAQPGSEPIPQSSGQAATSDDLSGEAPPPLSATGDPSTVEPRTGNGASETGAGDPGPDPAGDIQLVGDAVPSAPAASGGGNGVVMHVRSPVASYWRGQAYEDFDGRHWLPQKGTPVRDGRALLGNQPHYTQTYFIHDSEIGTTFEGYRGAHVQLSSDRSLYKQSSGKEPSYKVVSVLPDLTPSNLRADRPGRAPSRYYDVPKSMGWLPGMAREITQGSPSGYDKAVSIVNELRNNGRYDSSATDQLSSAASQESFLLDGEAGSSLDYATSTVMLARAAGLPARLATGYLPGERDPLSGAYQVRREDAHAWAEIYFREHGWVPFDGTHRGDPYASGGAPGGQLAGLKYLFESSVGDDLVKAAVAGPSKLASSLKDAFSGSLTGVLAAAWTVGIAVVLGWLVLRAVKRGRRSTARRWTYVRLPGSGRSEMLRIYARVERLLKKEGFGPRTPAQTLREYAGIAENRLRGLEAHLAWFTRAAWRAAYDPSAFPTDTVREARSRLASMKAALG